jgi:hypothetical protein
MKITLISIILNIVACVLLILALLHISEKSKLSPSFNTFQSYCESKGKSPVIFNLVSDNIDERIIICE